MELRKTFTSIIVTAIFILLSLQASLQTNQAQETLKQASIQIFYGLNESHSNSWAQNTDAAMIGISYLVKVI